MRFYIIAGEASGDLHGSNLIKAIKAQDPNAEIRCWGGDRMEAAGGKLIKHIRELAFMGFVEVITHLPTILGNITFCRKDILSFKPDVLILIDYPGFNMRIAEWAKKQGIPVVYYISPQLWAWKESRIHKIKRDVDKMLVILPFEKDFYQKWNYEVSYVGHPLTEVVHHELLEVPVVPLSQKPIIAILPGSRRQEVEAKLPEMLKMVPYFPDYQFGIACAPALPEGVYQQFIKNKNVLLVKNQTYNLLKQSQAAMVTSGTATLETALFGVPQVVCYKGNPISYQLAKRFVKIKYISLVNLIMDKPVVKELIQKELNEKNLKQELEKLLKDEAYRQEMKKDYAVLWQKLGTTPASETAAREILELISP